MQTFLTPYDIMDGYLILAILIYILGIIAMLAIAYHSPVNHRPKEEEDLYP